MHRSPSAGVRCPFNSSVIGQKSALASVKILAYAYLTPLTIPRGNSALFVSNFNFRQCHFSSSRPGAERSLHTRRAPQQYYCPDDPPRETYALTLKRMGFSSAQNSNC